MKNTASRMGAVWSSAFIAATLDSWPVAAATTNVPSPPGASPKWFWLGAIFFVSVLVFFLGYLVPYTNIVRDQGPNPGPSQFKIYSLSRCQMALWFFVVLGSYLLIYSRTSDTSFSDTALWLMGISFGTAAAAKAVDSGKVAQAASQQDTISPKITQAKAKLEALKGAVAPRSEIIATEATISELQRRLNDAQQAVMPQASESFVTDLLTDDGGAALHRFQMAVWTIVIAGIFIHDVVVNLRMPEFSSQLLALVGLSNGTYVGLKIPEK